MGDPLPCYQGIRTPHKCDIARRRVFPRRRMRQPRRVFRHLARQPSARSAPCGSARHFAPRPGAPPRRGVPRPARSPAPGGSLAVGGMPPPARYRERGVPCLCDASTAYAALSQRGTV